MKCFYCGKELQPDNVYCPHCGKAVQIVPDYSMYDDDYLKEVLVEENKTKSEAEAKVFAGSKKQIRQEPAPGMQNRATDTPERRKEQKKKQIKIIAGVVATIIVLIFAILVFCAAIQSNHNNSFDYQVKLAEKALQEGNLDQAVSYYERAVELDPNSIDARLALADIFVEKEDFDAAETLYKSVIADDRRNRKAFKNLIAIYEKEEKTDAIMALFKTADESLADLFANYQSEAPVFSLEEGSFDSPQTLQLRSPKGDPIYYTMDGSDPIAKGALYQGPIQLSENNRSYTIKAVCRNEKNVNSEVVTKNYSIRIPVPDMPSVSPDGGDFGAPTSVTIQVPGGCSAYYTWDGSMPNTASSRYTGPIQVPEGNNILSVIAYDSSTGLSSQVYRGNFIYYAEDHPQENTDNENEQEEAPQADEEEPQE